MGWMEVIFEVIIYNKCHIKMKKEDIFSFVFLVIILSVLYNLFFTIMTSILAIEISSKKTLMNFFLYILVLMIVLLFFKDSFMKTKSYNYFRKQQILFVETFKEPKIFLRFIFFDLLTLVFLLLIAFFTLKFIAWNFRFLDETYLNLNIAQDYLTSGNQVMNDILAQQLEPNMENIKQGIIFSGIAIIAAFFFLVAIISCFQGMNYAKLTKQNFNKKFFLRFYLESLILCLLYILLFILTLSFIKNEYGAYFLAFSFFVFVLLFFVEFACFREKEGILKNIRIAFGIVFKKFYLFIAPLLFLYTIWLFIVYGNGLLTYSLNAISISIIAFAMFFIYLSFFKFFIFRVVLHIKNE